MELAGWGQYPRHDADVLEPANGDQLQQILAEAKAMPIVARGSGRSYGDSALAGQVISSRLLDNFIAFDKDKLTLRCAAGVTLGEILEVIVPHGAFLPVLPGTRHVSVGGAIAADIHGKNHHGKGSFSAHIESLRLCLANGEIKQCSRTRNKSLFAATCGGMGLTGIIVDATLKLSPVNNNQMINQTLPATDLEHCLSLLQDNAASEYVVAWVDCLASGAQLGRGVVFVGEHAPAEDSRRPGKATGRPLTVPFNTPAFLLNRQSMTLFNGAYYKLHNKRRDSDLVHYQRYFFPLDRISHWNRLYGKPGFLQYQLVLPEASAAAGIREILGRVARAGKGSFLAVLKQFGAANDNYLSFPMAGLTLTLDFKKEASILPLLNELDEIVLAHQGRLYLAKDARMSAETFQAGYPRWLEFMRVKKQVDPDNRFASLQSDRLGLTPVRNATP